MDKLKGGFLFGAAGVLLVLGWLLYFFALHAPVFQVLVYAGWIALALGLGLIVASISTLRGRGELAEGASFVDTTTVVDKGIYAVVRHPLYLGWSLMYVAVLLLSQHWLVVVIGILGIACMYLISKREDRDLVERFGDEYERYIESVPALNLIAGVVRWLGHQKGM